MNSIYLIATIGLVAGLLSGMMGLGGAILIIPALVMLLGYSQQLAQGTALIMMVLPVGLLAAWQYYQKGFVDLKAALILAIFFFFSSWMGAKLATAIPQDILKKMFALMLTVIALKILFFDKA